MMGVKRGKDNNYTPEQHAQNGRYTMRNGLTELLGFSQLTHNMSQQQWTAVALLNYSTIHCSVCVGVMCVLLSL